MSTTAQTIAGLPVLKASEPMDRVKLLIYGDPGSGKTVLSASAYDVPEMRPVLLIDIEGGTKSIRHKWPEIEIIRIRDSFNDQGKIVKSGWKSLTGLYEEAKTGKLPYQTYIIDTISESYSFAMSERMREVVLLNPDRDPDLPADRDWGKVSAQVAKYMRLFRDLDRHVIFTALKETKEDRSTGRIINYVPRLAGKLSYQVAGFIDELVFLDVIEKKESNETKRIRRLLTQPVNKYLAKDRSDKLPLLMEEPTMSKIAELVLDKKGGTKK